MAVRLMQERQHSERLGFRVEPMQCLRVLRPLLLSTGLLIGSVIWLSTAHPLSGRVIDADNGRPLPGADVRVAGHDLLSDGQGRFWLRGLRGTLIVQAEAPGYRPLNRVLPLGDLIGVGRTLVLPLEPVELRGTVVDAATGAPVAGASVQVGERELEADAGGRFAVKRVLPGACITAQAQYYRDSDPLTYDGQAVQDIALSLLPVAVAVRDLCTGQPVAGATISAPPEAVESDAEGAASLAVLASETEVWATSEGYHEARGQASPGDSLVLELAPKAVSGVVRNHAGQPLANALVLAHAPGQEPRLTYTNAAGEYRLEGLPARATLVVRKAGYRRVERQPGPGPCSDIQLEPFVAKGIYLAFHLLTPAYRGQLQSNLDLVDRTELNAIVIEIKSETGYLGLQPQLPLARDIGAGVEDVIDVRQLLADCRRRGIYTIARIPVFEDDLLATQRPQWAVHRPDGSVWRAAGGRAWVDPFRQEVWDYNVAIAREAVELGFDEVQFDYVRFPSDGAVGQCRYIHESTAESRVEAINDFLAYARGELDHTGAFLSADLFGLTTFDTEEKGIGQLLDVIGPHLDYVSPMVYPSTYLPGMLDLKDPWRSPYEVVKLSLIEARKKTSTLIRPWLQHFDDYHGLGITYGLPELRLQKQGALEGESHGWLFWNILGEYNPAAFDPG